MHYEIHQIIIDDDFKICPTCGYRDGFHTMVKKVEKEMKHLYICPSCHDIFDVLDRKAE